MSGSQFGFEANCKEKQGQIKLFIYYTRKKLSILGPQEAIVSATPPTIITSVSSEVKLLEVSLQLASTKNRQIALLWNKVPNQSHSAKGTTALRP